MRPTDENQYGSTRPNLMSSSRRGSEESILSMLERDSGRSRRHSAGRMTLYGAAGLLVVALVGTVAWLARDSGSQQQVEPTLVSRPAPMVAMADVTPAPHESRHAEGAAIIDNPEPPPLGPRSAAPQPADPPPLVLVTPQATAAPKASEAVQQAAPARLPAAAPAKPARVARAEPARPRPAAKPAAAARSPVRKPAAKKGKPAERDRVDTDVQLLSAIISHSGKRAPDSEGEKPEASQ